MGHTVSDSFFSAVACSHPARGLRRANLFAFAGAPCMVLQT